jgi:hypothetical protein
MKVNRVGESLGSALDSLQYVGEDISNNKSLS